MEQVVMFLKQVINGVQVGSIYALVALGYTLVYGIVKLLNFAHGDFIMVGAYISLFAMTGAGMPVWLAAIIAVAGCALLGVLTEKIALQLFVKKTKMGRAMRAVSEDAQAATLMGVNVNHTISLTFAVGSGLAAIAAVMYCTAYPMVDPYMGSMLGLKAFIAAVLGGIGIIPGAMLGGFAIGLIESLTKAYISSQLADAVVFGILILVLLIKPAGIFGKNVGEKV